MLKDIGWRGELGNHCSHSPFIFILTVAPNMLNMYAISMSLPYCANSKGKMHSSSQKIFTPRKFYEIKFPVPFDFLLWGPELGWRVDRNVKEQYYSDTLKSRKENLIHNYYSKCGNYCDRGERSAEIQIQQRQLEIQAMSRMKGSMDGKLLRGGIKIRVIRYQEWGDKKFDHISRVEDSLKADLAVFLLNWAMQVKVIIYASPKYTTLA